MRMHDQCCSAVGKKDTTGTPIMFKLPPSHSVSLSYGVIVWVSIKIKKRHWGLNKAEYLEIIHIQRLPGNQPFLPSHQADRRREWNRKMEKKRKMDSLTPGLWIILQFLRACRLLCVGSHLLSFYSSRCCGRLWPDQSLRSSWCCSLWPGRSWLQDLCVYTKTKRHNRGDSENHNNKNIWPRIITKHRWFRFRLQVCVTPQMLTCLTE